MARGAAAHFRLDEILGVTVNLEAHVASVELYDCVRLCGCVVHEHLCIMDDVGGGRCFSGANFVERDDYCGIDSARDVEEGAGDTLHACDAAFINFWCGCGVGRLFHLGPIRGREPCVGGVLGAWGYGVLEAL